MNKKKTGHLHDPVLDADGQWIKKKQVSTLYSPTDNGEDGVHVTSSYDATSHFESASQDVMTMWKKMFGEELVLTVHKDAEAE